MCALLYIRGMSGKVNSHRRTPGKRQKVAIITTRHGAQDDRIYFKEALSLAKKLDVVMIAPDDGEVLDWHSKVTYYPIPRRRGILGRVLSVFETVKTARKENPDFCHVQDIDLALSLPFLRLLTRAKLIYDCHEAFPEQFLMNKGKPLLLRRLMAWAVDIFEKTFVRAADYVVTADEATRRSFDKIHVPSAAIFNYPPLHIFGELKSSTTKLTRSSSNRIVLVYHGSMSEDRGLFHMIEALSLLRKKGAETILLLVGLKDPSLKKKAEQLAEEGVIENMQIIEWVPHERISGLLKLCDIGLVPWQPEEKHKRNIPIKLFEYMACALPVVAADLPSIRPYVQKAQCGLLYDSTNAEELAGKVVELINDPQRMRQMGQNGRKAVERWWNWGKMEERLWEIYRQLGAEI